MIKSSDFDSATDLTKAILENNEFESKFVDIMNLDLTLRGSHFFYYERDMSHRVSFYDSSHARVTITFYGKEASIHLATNGGQHNDYGPSNIVICNDDGHCFLEGVWYRKNNVNHNNFGPAVKRFYSDGLCYYQAYFLNGEYHNSVGPAVINSYQRKFPAVLFYILGARITKDRFIKILEGRLQC